MCVSVYVVCECCVCVWCLHTCVQANTDCLLSATGNDSKVKHRGRLLPAAGSWGIAITIRAESLGEMACIWEMFLLLRGAFLQAIVDQ